MVRRVLKDFRAENRESACPDLARLRVGLATSGRFHLLDLARELNRLGVDVSFYSYVSRRRARRFGLPPVCHVALLPALSPLVAWERLLPGFMPKTVERLICWAQDIVVVARMKRCDVFGCMSGMYILAPRFAKWRYGAKVILYRASTHILAQKKVLAQNPDARQVSDFITRRELQGYAIADLIEVPSSHVVESFDPWPEHAKKLWQNPYGVEITQFPMRGGDRLPGEPTVLFVGHWSYRKGADVLAEAIRGMDAARLIHVGPLLDLPFPTDRRFVHHEPVAQEDLRRFYQAAHVFALASREEGFAYVLSQALASGLPVVCTDRTGGQDLKALPGFSRLVTVVPAGDPSALREALGQALESAGQFPSITDEERERLSWKQYALRELETMSEIARA
jgi:alpha-maltose-1-phosphate synthase